jgi:transcriptional regulator with XRE-family HTH domain
MGALADTQPHVEDLRVFLVERRHHLGLVQRDFADKVALSRDWVASFESGRLRGAPRAETLAKLAQAMALPGETPGLLNFLKLVLAGVFERQDVHDCAVGRRNANEVMADAAKGVIVPPPESAAEQEAWRKWQRLEEALGLIRLDLAPADYDIASALLRRMYGEVPGPPTAASGSKPRRRRSARTGEA